MVALKARKSREVFKTTTPGPFSFTHKGGGERLVETTNLVKYQRCTISLITQIFFLLSFNNTDLSYLSYK